MLKIQTLNKISPIGLDLMERDKYEIATEMPNPDGILVRSFKMNDMTLPDSLKCIARAGAGVNNIPIDRCTEKGVIVFNTPGANANGVKELVICGMILAGRKIFRAMNWLKSVADKGDEIPKLIEKEKEKFVGNEIKGKKLGLVGLGAIGVMVANDAVALGMKVVGFDPFISIESAWGLSREVKRATNLEALLSECDYISLHVPLDDKTKGMLNKDKFAMMKKGIKIMNFARGGLVDNTALKEAIAAGIVDRYVTDFADADLLTVENVVALPHLGASTPESEDNCATMAVDQTKDFLENGNIKNSVNFPACDMGRIGGPRLIIANKNVPAMVSQITTLLGAAKVNISDMLNRHKGDYAYNIIDVEKDIGDDVVKSILKIEGVIMARVLRPE